MSKKHIIAVAIATLALGHAAQAQTNLQVFYDFAPDRQHVTTTVEGFYQDNWGNTFFFVDHDFNTRAAGNKVIAPSGTYLEIARCLNFWQDTALGGLSLHAEYNGGVYNGFTINNAWLGGLDYFFHSSDFKNTLNVKVLGKYINYAGARDLKNNARKSAVPMQFTLVWGLQDLFGAKGLRFSGFADFWWESHAVLPAEPVIVNGEPQWVDSQFVFISEPQLWYNVGQWFGVPQFNIGGEVELSYDFGTVKGFRARPCAGIKWVF